MDVFKNLLEDIEYIHFNTEDDCEKFLKYASQTNISISHKCCDGKGCGIRNIKKEQLDIIIKEYLHLNSNNTVVNY
jgi:hypothetical protein